MTEHEQSLLSGFEDYADDINDKIQIISNTNILTGIDTISSNSALDDDNMSDAKILTVRRLSQLTDNDEPYFPLPPDTMTDIMYSRRVEKRCILCEAPEHLRDRAEHIYLENKQKPAAVVNFFAKYYGAKVTHMCVAQHMKKHCFFDHLYYDGLDYLKAREDSVAHWKYRELDLALTTLLVQLSEVRGEPTRGFDAKLKQTTVIQNLTTAIMKVRKDRDDSLVHGIDVFSVLADVLDRCKCDECKREVAKKHKELRQEITKRSQQD